MKKWILGILAVLLILGLWVGSYFFPMVGVDCVVRISRWSFLDYGENFDYYAIRGSEVSKVSPWVVELLAPEAITGDSFKNEDTTRRFAQLIYVPRPELFNSTQFTYRNNPWISSDYGENYRIYYSVWSGIREEAGPVVLDVMHRASLFFHDGDPSNPTAYGTGTDVADRGLTGYFVISHGTYILVQQDETLYLPMEDGSFRKLLAFSRPDSVDFFWFP